MYQNHQTQHLSILFFAKGSNKGTKGKTTEVHVKHTKDIKQKAASKHQELQIVQLESSNPKIVIQSINITAILDIRKSSVQFLQLTNLDSLVLRILFHPIEVAVTKLHEEISLETSNASNAEIEAYAKLKK